MQNFENTIKIFNNENVKIKNIDLENYVKNMLKKDDYNLDDLKEINEIIIDGKTISGNINQVYFKDIDLFPNLEKIVIKNISISNENLEKINNIKTIHFINCNVENIGLLNKQKEIAIINTIIDDINGLLNNPNLCSLELNNILIDNYTFLNNMQHLKKLKIKNIKNFNLNLLPQDMHVEYLSFNNLKEFNTDIVLNFKDLKILSLDMQEAFNYTNEIKELNDKVKVIYNDIYGNQGEKYDYSV